MNQYQETFLFLLHGEKKILVLHVLWSLLSLQICRVHQRVSFLGELLFSNEGSSENTDIVTRYSVVIVGYVTEAMWRLEAARRGFVIGPSNAQSSRGGRPGLHWRP